MDARPTMSADGRSLEAMKRSWRPLRAQLVKRISELDNELSRQHPDRTVIQVKMEMIQKCFEKVESLDESILPIVAQDCAEEEQDAELTTVSEYEEKYRTAKIRGESFLDTNTQSSSADGSVSYVSADSEAVACKKTYKLPKIELKKFSGELKDWLGFWSQFEKIHTDKSLHDSDKFQYLVQCMVPGSKAHLLVSSYPQSEANYPLAIDALKDRFGDKVLLTEVYVRQLLKLVMQNASKQKSVSLSTMYDELESHLRALETLGVTREQSAAFLYPLVESSLPVEVIKVWQRSILSDGDDDHHERPVDERLKSLMKFLRMEVKGAERLSYVTEGFGDAFKDKPGPRERGTHSGSGVQRGPPTAAGLLAGQKSTCIFCDKAHTSETCVTAQSMSYAEKKRKAMDKRACLACLKVGHIAKMCQSKRNCMVCHAKHVTLMCPELDTEKKSADKVQTSSGDNRGVHSQLNCTNDVVLQTLRCVVNSGSSKRQVRVLLDTGSQRSYILERTAQQLSAKPVGEAEVCHLLFGGVKDERRHNLYKIRLEENRGNFHVDMQVLGHDKICDRIPSVSKGPWMDELKEKKVFLTDLKGDGADIEVLIGADYYAKLITGRRWCLKNGLVAMETQL